MDSRHEAVVPELQIALKDEVGAQPGQELAVGPNPRGPKTKKHPIKMAFGARLSHHVGGLARWVRAAEPCPQAPGDQWLGGGGG